MCVGSDMGSEPPEKSQEAIGFLGNTGGRTASKNNCGPIASRGRPIWPSVKYVDSGSAHVWRSEDLLQSGRIRHIEDSYPGM